MIEQGCPRHGTKYLVHDSDGIYCHAPIPKDAFGLEICFYHVHEKPGPKREKLCIKCHKRPPYKIGRLCAECRAEKEREKYRKKKRKK